MGKYDHLSKAELVKLLEERDNIRNPRMPDNGFYDEKRIKKIISDVLMLLFSSEKKESIDKALHLLIDFFDTDWVYVATLDKEQKIAYFLYEVTSKWVHTSKEDSSELTSDTIPWMIDTILKGEDIILTDIDNLPPEACVDKLLLEAQGLLSMLVIPITYNGEVRGMIGFDSMRVRRHWTLAEVQNLHIIANIFSIIIERVQIKNDIETSRTRLIESDIKFKMIFENLPVGVELYDVNATLLDLNDADAAIFGTSKQSLIGTNLLDNPNLPDELKEALQEGRNFTCSWEYSFKRTEKWNVYDPQIRRDIKYLQLRGVSLYDKELGRIGFLLIITDNTEAHLKAEQTEDNLATLKAILLSGHSMVAEYDTIKQELFVNPMINSNLDDNDFFALFKKSPYLSQQELMQLVHPDDYTSQFSLFRQVAAGTKTDCSAIVRIVLYGKVIWLRTNIQAYKIGREGKPSKVVSYVTNITEEKELEIKLQTAERESRQAELEKQKAQEADKLKSAFLANMSHEIRTPLNAIVGFSSLMVETEDRDEQKNYLGIINKNSELLLGLISDILDFSKIESGKLDYTLSNVDLKEICVELCTILSLKTHSGVQMIFRRDAHPSVFLHTDAKRVTQVISNLLSNAVKFTFQGFITLSYRKQGENVYIEVADTGKGIPEKYIESIFQRFVKVDEFEQGTGLGLPICKTIIETLHGKMGVRSVLGEGSVFWFTLPIQVEKAGTDKIIVPVEKGEDEKTARSLPSAFWLRSDNPIILIAEDVAENYYLLEVLFGKKYTLVHAWNGEEAVAYYQQYAPSLILMDIKMPIMDGFEAACKIRSFSSDIPIIALTAFAFESEKQHAWKCKFNDYLVKPLNIPLLKKTLSKYLDN